MKKIQTLEYRGYKTEFYVTPRVEEYLKNKGINDNEFLPGPHNFYEIELFESLDDDSDGKVAEKYGKEFKVVYYGIITRWINKDPEGFEEDFPHKKEQIIRGPYQRIVKIHNSKESFGIKYLILKK